MVVGLEDRQEFARRARGDIPETDPRYVHANYGPRGWHFWGPSSHGLLDVQW